MIFARTNGERERSLCPSRRPPLPGARENRETNEREKREKGEREKREKKEKEKKARKEKEGGGSLRR